MSRLLVALAPLFLLASCSSTEVVSDYDLTVDFAQYKTFALGAVPKETTELPGYDEILGRQMQASIAKALEATGLKAVAAGSQDLLVSMTIGGQQRTDAQSYGLGWRFPGGSPDVYVDHYVEGMLVVDLFDRAKNEVVWHNYAEASLEDPKDTPKTMLGAVDKIMAAYPPGK